MFIIRMQIMQIMQIILFGTGWVILSPEIIFQ